MDLINDLKEFVERSEGNADKALAAMDIADVEEFEKQKNDHAHH